jgi:hypothetical protein
MKNKNLILLLAAGAAYWYFFVYLKNKKNKLPVTSPGFPTLPGQPGDVTITDEIVEFVAPERKLQYEQDGAFQTYYVNQVSGVKKMGVPFTI